MASTKVKYTLSALIVLVIVGFIVIAVRSQSAPKAHVPAETPLKVTVENSIGTLVSQAGDWQCVWKDETNKTISDGTIFFTNGRFKIDVEGLDKTTGTSLVTHAVSDAQKVYVWTNLAPIGFSMSWITAVSEQVDTRAHPENELFAKRYTFDCLPWTDVDVSFFVPPSGVTFTHDATSTVGVGN